jgi:two-component system heavy metal sensor histidine kinase CusS
MRRSGRPYSLVWRLSWLFAAQTLLGFGALSAAVYLASAAHLDRKSEVELERKVALVRSLVEEAASTGDDAAMRHKLGEFFEAHEDVRVTLFDASGALAFQSASAPGSAARLTARFDVPARVAGARLASGSIEMDRREDEKLLAGLAGLLAASTLVGAFLVSASGFWLARRSLRPLVGLARQTLELGAGRLSGARLGLDRPVVELMPWIDEFNALLGRVEGAYRQLEAFNADVAHELRTPLTTLIGHTELALRRPRDPDALRSILESNLEDLQRLSSIVNDMLFLARVDGGALARACAPAPLSEQVAATIDFHEAALAEAGLDARYRGEALASFDAGLIRRALSNLLGNAIRHSAPGASITVSIEEDACGARIGVSNEGAEIPPDDLNRIFDRFYRGQVSRSGGDGRHGLGLAIVAAIAKMHGGETFARSGGGVTTVGFTLGGGGPRGDSPRAEGRQGRVEGSSRSGHPEGACAPP